VKVHDRLPDLFAPDAVRSDEPETPCGVIQPLNVDLLRVREIDVGGQLERSVMAAGATFRTSRASVRSRVGRPTRR